MNREEFYRRMDAIQDLPTLPEVALELNRVLDTSGATIAQVCNLLQKDPPSVARLLRLVNSAFFGLQAMVSTVQRAVVILGLNTVRNALVSISVIESFNRKDLVQIKGFWRNGVACAVLCKHIALQSGLTAPDDAFTTGLLHDIGRLVLANYYRSQYEEIMGLVSAQRPFHEAALQVLPVAQDAVGVYLLNKWRLPGTITRAIGHHIRMADPEAQPGAAVLHCAVQLLEDEDAAMGRLFAAPGSVAATLRRVIENKEQWLPEAREEIQTATQFLTGGGS